MPMPDHMDRPANVDRTEAMAKMAIRAQTAAMANQANRAMPVNQARLAKMEIREHQEVRLKRTHT